MHQNASRSLNASECIVNECTRMHGNASDECAQNALGVQCSGMRENARMHWNAFAVEGAQNAQKCTVNAFVRIQESTRMLRNSTKCTRMHKKVCGHK